MELLDFVLKMRNCDVEKRKTHPSVQEDFHIASPTRAIISTHVSFVLSISNSSLQLILSDSNIFSSQIIPKKLPHDHEQLRFWE
jgi:rhamnose utilization protein RhaD (predicted bifunctional aldolase and dehydrogenase)